MRTQIFQPSSKPKRSMQSFNDLATASLALCGYRQAVLGKGLLHLLTSFRWSRSEQGLNLPIGKRPPQPLRRAKLESTKPKRTPEQVHHPHAGDDVIQLVILRQTIELPRPPEEEDVAQQDETRGREDVKKLICWSFRDFIFGPKCLPTPQRSLIGHPRAIF
jgi:hypothetical protein